MIIDQLRQKFPDMENLRVRAITVDKIENKVSCTVSYPGMQLLPAAITSEIRATVRNCIPTGMKYDIRLVNDSFNNASFVATLCDVLKTQYPLFANIKSDKIAANVFGFDIDVVLTVNKVTKLNMDVAELFARLQDYFRLYTCYKVKFSAMVEDEEISRSALEQQERLVQLAINRELLKPKRFYNVADVKKVIGKEISAQPMYIYDVRSPMESCVVCGRISEKNIKDTKNNPTLKICKFNLTDDSGATLPCVSFVRFQIDDFDTLKQTNADKTDSEIKTICDKKRLSNDKKMKSLAFLANGQEILVRGKVVQNQYSDRLELQVYDISKCRIVENSQKTFQQKISDRYVLVHPQQIEEYRQLTFDKMEETPSKLSGKDVVVLCANVTGYNATKDKILAICGVRLVNGYLKEKFYSVVSPDTPIEEKILSDFNLSVRQLSVSPSMTELMSDFMKFVGDSILVGTDLQKLSELINYYAAPQGYSLKNQIYSQFDMLSQLFDASIYESKPNCSQIADVAKWLKLPVRLSSNCQDVAMAVAKCMSVLCERTK